MASGKLALYREMFTQLEPGGALVIADLIAPGSEWERRFTARAWDAEVRRQSSELTGDERAWQQFDADDWNLYDHPDPMDMPSSSRGTPRLDARRRASFASECPGRWPVTRSMAPTSQPDAHCGWLRSLADVVRECVRWRASAGWRRAMSVRLRVCVAG